MRRGAPAWLALAVVALPGAPALARGTMPMPWATGSGSSAEPFSYTVVDRQPFDLADGDVQVRAEHGVAPGDGAYAYERVFLENKSGRPQPVELVFNGSQGDQVSRSLELSGGERRTVVLPIPSTVRAGMLLARGPGIRDSGRRAVHFATPAKYSILAVGSREHFEKEVGMPPGEGGSYALAVVTVTPDELSGELAAYAGFDAVLLLDSALSELPPEAQSALEAYAATGGSLVLRHPEPHPDARLPLLPADTRDSATSIQGYGFGRVSLCPNGCRERLTQVVTADPMVVRPHGPMPSWMRGRSRYALAGGTTPQDLFLLPDAVAPLGWFLLIIVAFAMAVGPGSFWVARRGGAAAVLLFIPATALGTCLLLVGYSLFHDGFTLHACTRSLTLLDRKGGRAVTLGLGSFYANLAPGGASFGAHDALVFPGQEAPQTASVDWTHGARFGADLLPSRTYREWGVLSVEPSRARLVVTPVGASSLRVENALGAHVRLAHVRWGGKLWHVSDLREGGQEMAQPLETAEPLPAVGVAEYANRFDPMARRAVLGALDEGEFLADLDGPGPLPLGGLPLHHQGSEALVRGRVDAR